MSPWSAARSRFAERFRILLRVSASLLPHGPVAAARSAAEIVAALGLDGADGASGAGEAARATRRARPRVVAAMIASADGRATVAGRSVGLGHPADSALLRELRTAVDAILVGTGTLRAERYAHLIDDPQRERRIARGLEPEPIVATIARSGRVPIDVPLFCEPAARVQVYAEADAPVGRTAAEVAVQRFAPGGARPPAVLGHLARARGVRSVLCEGGPTLLR